VPTYHNLFEGQEWRTGELHVQARESLQAPVAEAPRPLELS